MSLTLEVLAERIEQNEERNRERDMQILEAVNGLRTEIRPVVEIYRGGRLAGRALWAFLKFLVLLSTAAGAVTVFWHKFRG